MERILKVLLDYKREEKTKSKITYIILDVPIKLSRFILNIHIKRLNLVRT